MKNILVGNGINIQFDSVNYTSQNIILRMLKDIDDEHYPKHYIVNEPLLIKSYLAQLFLTAREILGGDFDEYAFGNAEINGLEDFKIRYSDRKKDLRIADIGFEDYYLVHDLLCCKMKIFNPERYSMREVIKMAYFHAIYNHGELNELHLKYPKGLVAFLNSFDNIFTTNYDSNIESATMKNVYHVHGQFDRLSEVYNPSSFRNQLDDDPLNNIPFDPQYHYLHSTALSTYCGDYKKHQIEQGTLTNQALEKMSVGYQEKEVVKKDIDSWEHEDNQIIKNLSQAIKLKVLNPSLCFQEDYSIKEFRGIQSELSILGLSPYNDYHLFEMIDNADISNCYFYYFSKEECKRITSLLPTLQRDEKLHFKSVINFWEAL